MRRIDLIGAAVPIGLATGLAAWLLAGGLAGRASTLDPVHARLVSLRAPAPTGSRGSDGGASALLGAPLFALTTGPGAVREPSIRLDGVSIARGRLAALVSIDGKSAAWLQVGQSVEGVTLQGVTSAGITIETALGAKTLGLGEQSAASSPAPGAPGPSAQAAPDQTPAGFRSPPEPASAPRSSAPR